MEKKQKQEQELQLELELELEREQELEQERERLTKGLPQARIKENRMEPGKVERIEYLLQFFSYQHLPSHMQEVSKPFSDLANQIVATVPSNPERTTALRKLLEAKDCAVRAMIFK